MVSRTISDGDTTNFVYNPDKTVRQINEHNVYNGALHIDSTDAEYTGGKVARLKVFLGGETRVDRSFDYNGELMARINYYGFGGSGWGITDHDSLVYQQGKLSEVHKFFGPVRSEVYKVTWDGSNIVKAEKYEVNQDQEQLREVHSYVYDAKPGFQQTIKGNILFCYGREAFFFLSTGTLLKEEWVKKPTNTTIYRSSVEYTYDAKGLMIKSLTTDEDVANNTKDSFTTTFEYKLWN